MSKKNKDSSKKSVKKPAAKKVVKKSAPAASKKAAKKPAPKAKAAKTPVKSSAKPVKSGPKKAASPKKIVKSVAKPLAKSSSAKASAKVSPKATKVAPVKHKPAAKPVASKSTKPAPSPAKAVPVKAKPAPALPKKEPAKVIAAPAKTEEKSKKQVAEKKSGEVLAITNTIPVAPKQEISASKIASISQSITNPIRRNDSYAIKVEKEPAGKFELEFVFHSSAEMLYEFVSTASGLSEWFCDDLNIRNGIYTFIWDDQLQQARLLKTIDLQLVRFQWVEKTDGSYFEFRIQKDDLTNDIALIVTDFAESISERESSKLLWNSQIEKLSHVLGSIF